MRMLGFLGLTVRVHFVLAPENGIGRPNPPV
jgi:hypothetical protein